MATLYRTLPIFLSGSNIVTGYVCPVDKTALIKQITLANESGLAARVDVRWCDKNSVGVGTTSPSNDKFYPISISGGVSGYSTTPLLTDFISIQENDFITYRTAESGRVNVIMTIIEQDILS